MLSRTRRVARRSWRPVLATGSLAAGFGLVSAVPPRGGLAWLAAGLILAGAVTVWSHVVW